MIAQASKGYITPTNAAVALPSLTFSSSTTNQIQELNKLPSHFYSTGTTINPSFTHLHKTKSPSSNHNTANMGAVVSCFQAIGACIMTVINAIAGVIMAIVNGIVAVLAAIVSFLTCKFYPRHTDSSGREPGADTLVSGGFCGKKGGRRSRGTTSHV